MRQIPSSLNNAIKNGNLTDVGGLLAREPGLMKERFIALDASQFDLCLGATILHFAACGASTELVDFLIKRGGDVNAVTTKTGATPLHCAVYFSQPDIVRMLLRSNANSEIPLISNISKHGCNVVGWTPLVLARNQLFHSGSAEDRDIAQILQLAAAAHNAANRLQCESVYVGVERVQFGNNYGQVMPLDLYIAVLYGKWDLSPLQTDRLEHVPLFKLTNIARNERHLLPTPITIKEGDDGLPLDTYLACSFVFSGKEFIFDGSDWEFSYRNSYGKRLKNEINIYRDFFVTVIRSGRLEPPYYGEGTRGDYSGTANEIIDFVSNPGEKDPYVSIRLSPHRNMVDTWVKRKQASKALCGQWLGRLFRRLK